MTVMRSNAAAKRLQTYQERLTQGQEPMPEAAELRAWIEENRDSFRSVMECDLKTCTKIVYDFSSNGDVVIGGESDPARQTEIMWQQLADAKAPVGVGRYREDRICYQSEQFKNDGENEASILASICSRQHTHLCLRHLTGLYTALRITTCTLITDRRSSCSMNRLPGLNSIRFTGT